MIQSEHQGHKAKGEGMRISDEQVNKVAAGLEVAPTFAMCMTWQVIVAFVLDLRDARARIHELEALSASREVKS